MKDNTIRFRGVRVHNLKDIDLDISRNRLTVITGVSGSGKSSLAFDTIYAEGQRRYVESLSTYARQFLEKMDRPDFDSVEGIPPAIAIQQKPPSRSSRSTVGTATEINDYLRLLFARIGRVHCRECGKPVVSYSIEDICKKLADFAGERAFIVTPMGLSDESIVERLRDLMKRGYARVMLDSTPVTLEEAIAKPPPPGTAWGIVVDRLALGTGGRSRLADSLEAAYGEAAYGESGGHLEVHLVNGPVLGFTSHHRCLDCDLEYDDPYPQLFSFNSPLGACPECNGFGNTIEIDMDLVVPDASKSLEEGAIKPWTFPNYDWPMEELRWIAEEKDLPMDVPFKDLSERHVKLIMNGHGDFPGVLGFFKMLEKKKYKVHVRVLMSRFRGYSTCSQCGGMRLKPEALAVKVGGKTIADVCAMRIGPTLSFLKDLKLSKQQAEVARLLLKEIKTRLRYLNDVGLDYLTLDRLTRTLSGGETQRINLASCLGSGLTDTLYILDEPSVGMHARDNARLIKILEKLRDTGNTVVVVEHDSDMISAADEIVDIGPGAGEQGGKIVFQGTVSRLKRSNKSLTGRYLSGRKKQNNSRPRRRTSNGLIRVMGAREHNLKNIDVEFPLGSFVCVTGVSGSGKSTLVEDILYRAAGRQKGINIERPGAHGAVLGVDKIDTIIMVGQTPIGRTPRSNPVTYIGAFSHIRKLFASTVSAQLRRLTPREFSFNVDGGRCPKCKGEGARKVEMQFFADVYLTCDACDGSRYKPSILEVRYKGKTIGDVLGMTVREALVFFKASAPIRKKLQMLVDTGLGYLRLGQPVNTLSTGEAQRIKLAAHIAEGEASRALFIFDEPTTGLHFHDIGMLIDCFNTLLTLGNSIIVVEHNMDVIRCADHIIDLGPEGGDEGGQVVACGSPDKIMAAKKSYTGRFLKRHLRNGQPASRKKARKK
jgi:excinuclease ABC subunit A